MCVDVAGRQALERAIVACFGVCRRKLKGFFRDMTGGAASAISVNVWEVYVEENLTAVGVSGRLWLG